MLHPYGRYCNANKFAGEIDVLEALDSVKKRYRVDDDRIAVRGFSMGGASTWQFAVHYPDRWFAAKMPRRIIRTDHENGGDQLRDQRFVSWKNREPHSHPTRNHRD